jgi:hypothetical protein
VLLEYQASLGGGGAEGGEEEAQQIEDATHLLIAVGHRDGEQEAQEQAGEDDGEAGKGEKRPRSEGADAKDEQAAQRPRGE